MGGDVPIEDGRQRQDGGHQCRGHGSDVAPATAGDHEPRHPQRDDKREVDEVIPVRRALQHPADREQHEPRPAPCLQIRMETEQRDRHPERDQHLDVRQVARPVRRERIGQARQECRGSIPGQPPDQRAHRHAAQRIRQQQCRVVGGDRVAGQPLDRRGNDAHTEQVLGQRECIGRRVEDRELIPGVGPRHVRGVPRQNGRREQRVARIAGDSRGEAVDDLTPHEQGDREITDRARQEQSRRVASRSHVVTSARDLDGAVAKARRLGGVGPDRPRRRRPERRDRRAAVPRRRRGRPCISIRGNSRHRRTARIIAITWAGRTLFNPRPSTLTGSVVAGRQLKHENAARG